MKSSRSVIHGKEKQNAGQQVETKRMEIANAFAGKKFIGQPPRFDDEEADGGDKF